MTDKKLHLVHAGRSNGLKKWQAPSPETRVVFLKSCRGDFVERGRCKNERNSVKIRLRLFHYKKIPIAKKRATQTANPISIPPKKRL